MVDTIVSIVIGRLATTIEDHLRQEINFMRGVEKDFLNLSSELKMIRNMLDDAETRGFKEKSVKEWLNKLEAVSHELEDVVDEWNYNILKHQIERSSHDNEGKVCKFFKGLISCSCFKKILLRRCIDKKMEELKEKIESVLEEKDRFMFITRGQVTERSLSLSPRIRSTSYVDESEIYGRGSDRDVLVNKLIMSCDVLSPKVLCIVGAGGIGKTTLAQMIYNDVRITDCFDLKLWVCVSDVFDEVRIAKGILECASGNSYSYMNELEVLLTRVSDSVSGKRFLLVLDDVWNEDYSKWEPLRNCLKHGGLGSKILVTTRNERAARTMDTTVIHRLDQLSDLDCCSLLRSIAFFGSDHEEDEYKETREEISFKIAEKCKGLPLAAKAMGSLLRFKTSVDEWENVLRSETWELEEKTELFPHLLVSYNELSPAMKRCFSYCSVFPKSSKINVAELIKQWMALGYLTSSDETGVELEIRGREYFENLSMRSFFQDFERDEERIISCKMHDIVHDFARFLRKSGNTESKTMRRDKNHEADDVISQAMEYRSLFYEKDQVPEDMFKSLTCLKVLSLRCGRVVPVKIERLVQLRYLNLSCTSANPVMKSVCKLYNLQTLYLSRTGLAQVPDEIGNLIQLRHLDLSWNPITELPDSICNLQELRTLNVEECSSLSVLPEGINRLVNLRHFHNTRTNVRRFPDGFRSFTGLRTLNEICIGKGCNGFGFLQDLNQIRGSLCLFVDLSSLDKEQVLYEARNANLGKKVNVREMSVLFSDRTGDEEENEKILDVMEAIRAPPNLHSLFLYNYNGFKFPKWMTSSLNLVKEIKVYNIMNCSSMPDFGKLPCLEIFSMGGISGLRFLGREFLGIKSGDLESGRSSDLVVGFPKLKRLIFGICPNWKEWEDITEEEEEREDVSVMPCLRHLEIRASGLTALPEHLLRKTTSLEEVWIKGSPKLKAFYEDRNGSAWKSVSHIPRFNF